METVDAAISVILVVLGFVLGLLAEPITEYFRRRRLLSKIAVVLSSEISMIRVLAARRIAIHEESLRNTEKMQSQQGSVQCIAISDADFPSSVHDASIVDIGLLSSNLVSLISDLYVLTNQANHVKEENRKSVLAFNSFVASTSGRQLSDFEVNSLRTEGQTSFHYVKAYLRSLHNIVRLADEALGALDKVSSYVPSRRSVVELDETLKEEYEG